ncbi:cell division protein FtsQ/DivIB [Pseudonocardia xinjiangensis]|uniref:cell division protein FtsQ/DivIB n=1 Tax=Pseudonocardia xinjiangensis TaxID=75289 RepID=UPI003D8EA372
MSSSTTPRPVSRPAPPRSMEDRPTRRPPGRQPRPAVRPVPASRYRRRRLAALLVALLLLVGLGLTGRVLLYDVGLADVENVQVTVANRGGAPDTADDTVVPVDDVVAAAGVTVGAPLAAVDTAGVANRVAQLPGVESVRVTRNWLHTVTIDITERVAVATVQTAQGLALVDRSGAVYPGAAAPGLPRFTFGAVGPDDPSTQAAVAVLAALPDSVRTQILTVDATDTAPDAPGQVTLGLSGGRQIRWGSPDRSADKAAVIVPLLTQPGHVFDVTSPDLPTIKR